MFDNVTVTASARLHLGFLDMNGGLGRRFGSLGLAIDRPVTCLRLQRGAAFTVKDWKRSARPIISPIWHVIWGCRLPMP